MFHRFRRIQPVPERFHERVPDDHHPQEVGGEGRVINIPKPLTDCYKLRYFGSVIFNGGERGMQHNKPSDAKTWGQVTISSLSPFIFNRDI